MHRVTAGLLTWMWVFSYRMFCVQINQSPPPKYSTWSFYALRWGKFAPINCPLPVIIPPSHCTKISGQIYSHNTQCVCNDFIQMWCCASASRLLPGEGNIQSSLCGIPQVTVGVILIFAAGVLTATTLSPPKHCPDSLKNIKWKYRILARAQRLLCCFCSPFPLYFSEYSPY
jgi:hypothetical protein